MTDPQPPAAPEPMTSAEPQPAASVQQDAAVHQDAPAQPSAPVSPTAERLSDGEWHRLHPATPLLKGGIAFLAVLGVVIVNLRDVLIEMFISGQRQDDPLLWVWEQGYLPIALAGFAVLLILFMVGFYLSWRFHTFRITDELVEVRSGILFRTHRRGRLDRIQGINIVRPLVARIFGAAKLEVNVAGQDANVQLSYLASGAADDLRREILRLASGVQREAVQQGADAPLATAQPGLIEKRVGEFLAPELDPNEAPPESVVKMNPGRLIGSILLSESTIILVLVLIGIVVFTSITGELFALLGFIPAVIGLAGYTVSRFTKSLRYSIAATPDGVRVGFGLLSVSNETLPPGRIHSLQIWQPLLWRFAGWWTIRVNRASRSTARAAAGQENTTILPVGSRDEAIKVLGLLLPDLGDEQQTEMILRGLEGKGGDDGFVNSPRRAAVLRWFSWRRNGFAIIRGAILLRKGRIWRELVIVPPARMQSVALHQGPIERSLRVASVNVHTVAGPITPRLGAVDAEVAIRFFGEVASEAVHAVSSDRTHRWRSGETPA